MTSLICTGTLFSNWQEILQTFVPEDSPDLTVNVELSDLANELCQRQFPGTDQLDWKSFKPSEEHGARASQLFSHINNETLFIWSDINSSLNLNFWKTAAEDARFVLFYSSPEFELCNYITTHPFDESRIEKVINAWFSRTQAMLNFFMNNRDRCVLVDVQTADSTTKSFVKTLSKQFDLDLKPKSLTENRLNENSALIEYMATTLLLKNQRVSELYDDLRSAATLINDIDKSIADIESRNKSLINAFLAEVTAYKQLSDTRSELEDELSLNQIQINQMAEELEYYFKKRIEKEKEIADLEKITNTIADYLSNDPLLKVARQVRQTQ